MAITTQAVKVDLNTGKVLPVVYAHQNDTNRAFAFEMYNNGVEYSMTGATVKFGYKSPVKKGAYFVITGTSMASGSVSGNTVTLNVPKSYLEVSGDAVLTMIIFNSSASIRPINIKMVVQSSADGDDTIASASDFVPVLEEYMSENMQTFIDGWLDDHPEATTTVEDGSITVGKLHEDVSTQLYPSVAYYGITTSTVDCGAVVNNLLSNGVTVFRFLNGTYTFTTPITADIKNCLFIGESGTVLKNNTGGYLVTSAKISRTTFSNFNVDGGSGFYMINTSTSGYYYAYVHFDKVMFTNVETAITYGGKGGYIYVDKCIIRANDVGIIIGNTNAYTTENFYVRDCQIGGVTDGTSTGIEVHSGQNIYITGNDLPKLDTAIKVFNDIERPVSYLQIENNNIYGFTTNGILFHPTISASTAYIRWGTVERNVFFTTNNVTAISNDTSIAVRNYSFSDNMFTLTNGTALAVDGSFATSYWNGGNSCNGSNWFNRLGSTFKPTFDGTLPHYKASVPASGSTTVNMPSSYSTQWQKFVYALVFPTQGNNLQYLTSSVDTTTGAVTVNNSSTSAVTVSVSWMS